MWVSQALMSVLFLMATTAEGFHSELYSLPGRFQPPEVAPIPMRDTRSGIFWTGSRYSRRGSSDIKKVKQRADRFYIGSRYGKRSDSETPEFESDLCKYTSFHPLYPCNNSCQCLLSKKKKV